MMQRFSQSALAMLRLSRTDEQTSMTCKLGSWLDIVCERLPRRPFISGFGCVALFVAGSPRLNTGSHLHRAIGWWRPRSSIWRLYNTLLVVVPAKQSSFFPWFVLSMARNVNSLVRLPDFL